MKIIVLAGGSGSRLFPLSREEYPKQFLNLFNSHSLFQQTILRAKLVVKKEDNILILSNKKYSPLIKQHLIPLNLNPPIIFEPAKRNTASAIALATKYLIDEQKASEDTVMFISPSDHMIFGKNRFITALTRAEALAKKGYIVTFGIIPSKPHTGYGYIEAGQSISDFAYKVNSFKEKPPLKLAQEYIKSGNYFWNSGMFAFTIKTILQEFKNYAPDIYSLLSKYTYQELYENFEKMPDISIDYAVMEYTKKAAVIPTNIVWSDIGSLESIYDNLEKDAHDNACKGQIVTIDTKHSLLLNESKKLLLTTVGVDSLIAIVTDDVITLVKQGEGQGVRKLVDRLKKSTKYNNIVKRGTTIIYPWGQAKILNLSSPFIIQIKGNSSNKIEIDLAKFIKINPKSTVSLINNKGNAVVNDKNFKLEISPASTSGTFDLVAVIYGHK